MPAKKRKVKEDNRQFNPLWDEEYIAMEKNKIFICRTFYAWINALKRSSTNFCLWLLQHGKYLYSSLFSSLQSCIFPVPLLLFPYYHTSFLCSSYCSFCLFLPSLILWWASFSIFQKLVSLHFLLRCHIFVIQQTFVAASLSIFLS